MAAETIVFYASPDHINTMLVLAKLIAKHHHPSISVVFFSTASVDASALPSGITYHPLPIPDLPPNLKITIHVELLFEIARLNNSNLHLALQEISRTSKIRAFVMDFFCNPAFELVSTTLNIPTYFYFSSSAYGLCFFLYYPTLHDAVPNLADLNSIDVPGCPLLHPLDLPKFDFMRGTNIHNQFLDVKINMRRSNGLIVNSFDALEFRAKEALSNGLCVPNAPTPPVYFVGPLIPENNKSTTTTHQINGGNVMKHECLHWLDSQPIKSVIFLCFGRRGLFSAEQIKEIAIGLENSGHKFLWSVRKPPGKHGAPNDDDPDLDELLPEGFLERTKDRGFVIKSWAPQKEVLSHNSVGGFVTHCGRSSLMEALSFGVPMIGWPLYAEQRLNRVFMVKEMQVALPLEETEGGFVTAVELEKRVKELLDSKTGRDIGQRVGELKVAAEAAVKKDGSSITALKKFVELVTRD